MKPHKFKLPPLCMAESAAEFEALTNQAKSSELEFQVIADAEHWT